MISPSLLPRTVQLCIHCHQNPAGFWVSRPGDQVARRPWCLSCCDELSQGHHDVLPFDATPPRPGTPRAAGAVSQAPGQHRGHPVRQLLTALTGRTTGAPRT